MRVIENANHLGLNRRRIDRWLRLDALPERNRMEPRPGMVESFRNYLQQLWDTGQAGWAPFVVGASAKLGHSRYYALRSDLETRPRRRRSGGY